MGAKERKMFARRLRDLRVGRKMSQEMLAEVAGIHRNYVGRLERGEQSVTLDRICQLARALNVKPGALFEGIR